MFDSARLPICDGQCGRHLDDQKCLLERSGKWIQYGEWRVVGCHVGAWVGDCGDVHCEVERTLGKPPLQQSGNHQQLIW